MNNLDSTLFDNFPLGFLVASISRSRSGVAEDLVVDYINQMAEMLLQVEGGKVLNNYYYEEYSTRDRILLDMCAETVYTGKVREYSSYRPQINKYIQISAYKISGDRCGVIIKDITNTYVAERMVEKQAVTLQRIYDTLETGLINVLLDEKLTIVRANQAAYRILGYTKESFSRRFGSSLLNIPFENDISQIHSRIRNQVLYGVGERYEHRVYDSHDELIWLHSFLRRTKNNEGTEIIHIEFRNCTKRKQLEMQLASEREKYRMAIKNTDYIIFEYSVKSDTLICYGSLTDRKCSKDRPITTENYSKALSEGEVLNSDEAELELNIIGGIDFTDSFIEHRNVIVNGEKKTIRVSIVIDIIRNADDKMERIVGKAGLL